MSLDKEIQDSCEICQLWKTSSVGLNWSAKKVMGSGPKDAKIMFIGESLGQEEVIQQKVFVGSAGKLLNEAITNAGLKREDVYVSNVIKCRPPDNRLPTNSEIKCCLPFLLDEIKEVKPKVICVLGGTALQAILNRKGITTIRGNIFETEIKLSTPIDPFDESAFLKIKVIPTLHPAYVLRWLEHPEYKELLFKDIELVAKASKSDNYQKEKKQVDYNLNPSLAEVILLLNTIKNINKTFTYDIETTGFNFLTDKILTMAISTEETKAFVIDFTKYGEEPELKESLKEIFESKTILKIGHNCLTNDAHILLDNTKLEDLGVLVKSKSTTKVKTFNEKLGLIEDRKITNHYKKRLSNSTPLNWLRIFTEFHRQKNHLGSGLVLTKDHKIFTHKGWIEAQYLKIGDKIAHYNRLTDIQEQLILGSCLGDGSLELQKTSKAKFPQFSISHSDKQEDYLRWKHEILKDVSRKIDVHSNEGGFNKRKGAKLYSFTTKSLYELQEWIREFYPNGKKVISDKILDKLTPLSIAVWYMDDGSFCKSNNSIEFSTESFSSFEIDKLQDYLLNKYYIESRKSNSYSKDRFTIEINKKESRHRFFELISKYIIPSMYYKIPLEYRGYNFNFDNNDNRSIIFGNIEIIEEWNGLVNRNKGKRIHYCLEIEETHNFFANDILVANCKFDNEFIRQLGIVVKLPQFDTMLAHFLLDENYQHGLKDLAWRYTDMGGYEEEMNQIFKEKVSTERKNLQAKKKAGTISQEEYDIEYQKLDNFSLVPIDILKKYNCADVDCTYRLYNIFKEQLEVERLKHIHDLILMPLQYVLTETEYEGIQIDIEYMNRFEKETKDKIEDIRYRINNSTEVKETEKFINKGILEGDKKYTKFNMNSNKQLQVLLFTVSKLQPVSKTATGYSTDASTLEILSTNSEIARMILEYRKYNHDLTAYIEQLKRNLDKNNKAHTDYMIHGSVSGRIISHEPNLQNIPRDSGVKRLFIADSDCILISADYSQVEYKMLANYTNDSKMLSDINNNLDIHSEMACMVWPHYYKKLGPKQYQYLQTNEIKHKVEGEHRVIAKAVVFGVMYGRGIKSLVEDLKITEIEGHKIIDSLFAMYPAVSEWIENQKRIVKRDKMVTNLFGRRRRLPDIDSKEEQKRAEVYRQCVNTPIQAGAADLCSIATVRCYNNIRRQNLRSRLVLSIHDALKYNVPLEEIEQLIDCVKRGMTDPVKGIKFNLEVEFEIGHNWGDMIELSEFNKDRNKWLKNWGYERY